MSGAGRGDPPEDRASTGWASGERGPPERRAQERGPSGRVPAGQLDRVIRRAAELQAREARAGDSAREGLTEAEIVSIGREVGLEPHHVRRALAELRARSLAPGPLDEEGVVRSLLGPAAARARRIVPGEPSGVQAWLEEHFREHERLQPIREREGRSLWEPASGLLNQMRRSLDVTGHGYVLAEARTVELSVAAVGGADAEGVGRSGPDAGEVVEVGGAARGGSGDRGREGAEERASCLVTLTADLRNQRSREAWVWGGIGVGLGSSTGLVLVVAAGLPALPVGAALAVGLAGTTAGGVRWSLARKRDRTRLVMEGLLDRLERGESPRPRVADPRGRASGGAGRERGARGERGEPGVDDGSDVLGWIERSIDRWLGSSRDEPYEW